MATVVRTVAATAAKAGAKAVILPDGTISEGWIGGGCARAAVLKAARDALADGKSRLVSVQPPGELDGQGHRAGEEQGGVRFAKNMCPSQGTMDIFVEPVLPRPQVVICGSSPVAVAVADLAKRSGFAVTVCAPTAEQAAFAEAERRIEGYALPVKEAGARAMSSSRRRGAATKLRSLPRSPSTSTTSPSSAAARKPRRSRRRWRSVGLPPSGWPSSRRRRASISAPSRRTRSRSRSWRKSLRVRRGQEARGVARSDHHQSTEFLRAAQSRRWTICVCRNGTQFQQDLKRRSVMKRDILRTNVLWTYWHLVSCWPVRCLPASRCSPTRRAAK